MPGSSSASCRERLLSGVERVAMRALDAPHALFLKHTIELAAGAAIAVEAEDLVVGLATGANLRPHRVWDPLRMVMQLRRQAGDIDVIELERQHLARERAAGDDEDLARALALPGKLRLGVNVIDCERHVTVAK